MSAATLAEMSLPGGSSIPSDYPAPSSAVEEEADGDAASRYVQASQRMHAELMKYIEGRNKITELLAASQNEMYVRLWTGSYAVLPCWPCRCSNVPKDGFTAMQEAASNVVIAASTLGDTFKHKSAVKIFGDLGKKGLPVQSVSRITELIFSSTKDIVMAFPSSMAPGSVILPKGDNIWSLLEKVMQVMDEETKIVQTSCIARKRAGGRAAASRSTLLGSRCSTRSRQSPRGWCGSGSSSSALCWSSSRGLTAVALPPQKMRRSGPRERSFLQLSF